MFIKSYLKYLFNANKSLCVISKFVFNSIIITFLYANMCIVYDSKKYLNSLIMLFILKFFFHYFLIMKYDLALSSISKMLIFKSFRFVSINTFSIISFFKFNLYFVSRNFLIFLTNVIVIVFISSLSINVIIFFFLIHILMITMIMFFVKYNTHNNLDLFIISINFLYLRY